MTASGGHLPPYCGKDRHYDPAQSGQAPRGICGDAQPTSDYLGLQPHRAISLSSFALYV